MGSKSKSREKYSRIYTTFFDLVRTVNQFTDDDNLVIAAVEHLVNSCRTRMADSSAPVKVVPAAVPSRNRSSLGRHTNRRYSNCQWSRF